MADLRTERLLLRELIAEPRRISELHPYFHARHLTGPMHGEIFSAIARLAKQDVYEEGPVDAAYLGHLVNDRDGVAADIGQMARQSAVPELGALSEKIIAQAFGIAIIRFGEQIANFGRRSNGSTDLSEMHARLTSATSRFIDTSRQALVPEQPFADGVRQYATWIADDTRQSGGIQTGIALLDNTLRGLHPGRQVILGARPSVGKTTLAVNVCRQALIDEHRVMLFSLEMLQEEIIGKFISLDSGVAQDTILDRSWSDEEHNAYLRSLKRAEEWDCLIVDEGVTDVDDIVDKVRHAHAERPVDIVCVDFLQLLAGTERTIRQSRNAQLEEASRTLKKLAKDLKLSSLLISQLSRDVEKRHVKRPTMADLRDSGSIEQDGDVILFIYRGPPGIDDIAMGRDRIRTELDVAKHRHGRLAQGTVTLLGATGEFADEDDPEPFWDYPEEAGADADRDQHGA